MPWEKKKAPLLLYTPPVFLLMCFDGFLARKLLSCAKPFSSASAPTKIPPAERRHEKFAVAI